jgi:hypothetical protein
VSTFLYALEPPAFALLFICRIVLVHLLSIMKTNKVSDASPVQPVEGGNRADLHSTCTLIELLGYCRRPELAFAYYQDAVNYWYVIRARFFFRSQPG